MFCFCSYIKKRYSYWSAQGIPGPKPTPFLGDLHKRFTSDVIQFELDNAATYGKTHGTYIGLTPALITSDLNLLKVIFVKDFPNFVNRFRSKAIHEMWGENLLFSMDEKWKRYLFCFVVFMFISLLTFLSTFYRIRAITTASFTAKKLRSMAPQMNRCIDNLVTYLDEVIITSKGGIFDTKQVKCVKANKKCT